MSHTTLRIGRNRRNFAIFSKKKSRRASFSGAVRVWRRISFDPESTAKQMVDPPLCLLVGNRPVLFAPVCCTQRPLPILVPAISPGRERGTNVDVSRRETRRTTRRTTQRRRIGARVLSVPSHDLKNEFAGLGWSSNASTRSLPRSKTSPTTSRSRPVLFHVSFSTARSRISKATLPHAPPSSSPAPRQQLPLPPRAQPSASPSLPRAPPSLPLSRRCAHYSARPPRSCAAPLPSPPPLHVPSLLPPSSPRDQPTLPHAPPLSSACLFASNKLTTPVLRQSFTNFNISLWL